MNDKTYIKQDTIGLLHVIHADSLSEALATFYCEDTIFFADKDDLIKHLASKGIEKVQFIKD